MAEDSPFQEAPICTACWVKAQGNRVRFRAKAACHFCGRPTSAGILLHERIEPSAEKARARARASWADWDKEETEHELQPWPEGLEAQPTEPRPEWLAQVRHNLHTQDNRITAHPMFVVQQRVRVYGFDPAYTGQGIAWLYEGVEQSADSPELRIARDEYWQTNIVPDGWTTTAWKDRWEFVTACFTEQGCKDYLKADGHNLTDPRIYVASGHRNREWQLVREWLGRPWPGSVPVNPHVEFDDKAVGQVFEMLDQAEGEDDSAERAGAEPEPINPIVELDAKGAAKVLEMLDQEEGDDDD